MYQVVNILFKTPMLISDLCGYNDEYIIIKGTITIIGDNDANKRDKKLIFKNYSPFRSSISKINNTLINNAKDIDIVMLMYNLLEYSENYSSTSRSLWNYCRDEINDPANENNEANNYRTNNSKTGTSKSFECKTKIMGRTSDYNNILDTEVVFSLKAAEATGEVLGNKITDIATKSRRNYYYKKKERSNRLVL